MMKLAAQKYIELKSEHFGKNSMSVFGGEFIRRLLKALEGATLAPIAEVDETACADAIDVVEVGISALRSFVLPAESDAPTEAESAALLAGLQMEAEGPASNPAPTPTPKKPPSAKRTAPEPRFASDGANTHHVVWLNIVSDDTNQNWFKVRSRTLDHDGSHARMQRRNLRRLGTTSTRCSQRTRKTTRTSPKPTFGWTVPAICTTPACSQFLPTAKRIRAYACSK